eukprot:180601-Amphidinium_carterae.1
MESFAIRCSAVDYPTRRTTGRAHLKMGSERPRMGRQGRRARSSRSIHEGSYGVAIDDTHSDHTTRTDAVARRKRRSTLADQRAIS